MSTTQSRPTTTAAKPKNGGKVVASGAGKRHGGSGRRIGSSILALGEPMVWLTGGALALCIVMIIGLMLLVVVKGGSTFWPVPVIAIDTIDNETYVGEVTRTDYYMLEAAQLSLLGDDARRLAEDEMNRNAGELHRRLLRTGNYELTNTHFTWISDFAVTDQRMPPWAMVVERVEWGRFYGVPKSFMIDGEAIVSAEGLEGDTLEEAERRIWDLFLEHHDEVIAKLAEIKHLEKEVIGGLNYTVEAARLRLRGAEMNHGKDSAQSREAQAQVDRVGEQFEQALGEIRGQINTIREEIDRFQIVMTTSTNQEKAVKLADIVRMYPANQLSLFDKMGVYLSRWNEFLTDDPREANQEGGVFPAIFGTVLMTIIMAVAVVPFGVLAALYLREYAKAGPMISAVRIAINNLAGVPSIVFGVFGLGFFCYIIGASIDELLFAEQLPNPTFGKGGLMWASLTLALLTLPVVIVATEEALSSVPNSMREGSYACGASKWQTIKRIILPRAMPGIMTGTILAMARGAGEVAPLMLVGAVKLAPELPGEINLMEPYVHVERSFMHLGFHIYDVGFQSPNAEAAKPMVFTTTLLLILIVAVLNVLAIWLRSRLRRRFVVGQF